MSIRNSLITILLVYVVNLIAGYLDLYETWLWFDIPMHFAGGLTIGFLGVAIWQQGIEEIKFKGRFKIFWRSAIPFLFVIGFASFIGIVWEMHEFILDMIFSSSTPLQPSLEDTIADLCLDIAGATAAVMIFRP